MLSKLINILNGKIDIFMVNDGHGINGTLFSDFASNQSISKAANFAGGGGLEFGLLDLSGNIIAALDRDASGTFNAGDLAFDVQDNVTSVAYNASNDVFTFIV